MRLKFFILNALAVVLRLFVEIRAEATSTSEQFHLPESEYFLRKRYTPGQKAHDDEFCETLAASCPYLRSNTARPASLPDIPVRITVDFLPINFIGIDDREQQFSVQGTFWFSWELPFCARWNDTVTPIEDEELEKMRGYHLQINRNVTRCFFNRAKIWHPPVRHYNAMTNPDVFEKQGRHDVRLDSSGWAYWRVSYRFDSSCSLEFEKFPFDEQLCTIEVIVMGEYGLIFDEAEVAANDRLFDNSIWDFRNVTSAIVENDTLLLITYTVSRRSQPYLGTVFLPTTLLAILQLFSLAMAPDLPDRSTISMTVFLALAVELSMFSDFLPITPNLLYITIYFQVQMAIAVAITIYCLVISRLLGRCKGLNRHFNCSLRCIGPCINKLRMVDWIDILVFFLALILCIFVNVAFYVKVIY